MASIFPNDLVLQDSLSYSLVVFEQSPIDKRNIGKKLEKYQETIEDVEI